MKYYIGFLFAFLLVYIVSKLQIKYNIFNEFNEINRQTQSHKLFIRSALDKQISSEKVRVETQAQKHEKKTRIKVIIMDDQAYWVKDNVFYTADMSGEIVDKETTRVVDTMTMSKVQLDKMVFIMDRLREGIFDDSGSAGN
ncbi:MAG: hypothetical protein EB127_04960 [Alphaproteobacteria bacterium]|nr:hypothetical protein [Alphaproteobacteria bacterium]